MNEWRGYYALFIYGIEQDDINLCHVCYQNGLNKDYLIEKRIEERVADLERENPEIMGDFDRLECEIIDELNSVTG